jgi:hypothetical protein
MSDTNRIAVVGYGYVGFVAAGRFSELFAWVARGGVRLFISGLSTD